MPSPLTCRSATLADHAHYARLLPELGVEDPVLPQDRWASAMMAQTLLFEEEGDVVGYAWVVPMADLAYVRHVVVAPGARGRGVGKSVMRGIAERMRAAGCVSWSLNVKIDNTPAIRLYTSVGLSKAYESTAMRVPWDVVPRLPTDEGVHARPLEPQEDASAEKAFGLPINRIGELRGREGWVFLRLVDQTNPEDLGVGLACYWPTFPGAYPFRVKHPSFARPLLEAMREHKRPEHDFTHVTSEDDAALKKVLVDAGAVIKFELFHMIGKIPDEI